MRREVFICLLLAGITLGLYWPVGRMGFIIHDDHDYVVENAHVQAGITLASVRWSFTSASAYNWHPVTWLSHMLDVKLFGLDPAGPHWVNLGIHIANTLLLFLVILEMRGGPWRAALVAALFAWHPTHVESVAWISERKDVLSGLFFFLTLWAYVKYAKGRDYKTTDKGGDRRTEDGEGWANGKYPTSNPPSVAALRRVDIQHPTSNTQHPTSIGGQEPTSALRPPPSALRPLFHLPSSLFYFLSLTSFALGLMSKPMLVTVPLILLLVDFWPLQRFPIPDFRSPFFVLRSPPCRRLVFEKVLFFALSLASCGLTLWAQAGAVVNLALLPWYWRFLDALVFYTFYLEKMFWPAKLSILYPYEQMSLSEFACSALLPILLTVIIVRRTSSKPHRLAGWLWFVIMLVPVIGLVQVGTQTIANRYTYLPSIGLFLLVAWEMAGLAALSKQWRKVMGVSAAALLAACLVDTRIQLDYWRNSITLFQRATETTRGSYCYFCLGSAYQEAGDWVNAARNYRLAVQLLPSFAVARSRLGHALSVQGKYAEAQPELAVAEKLLPGDPWIRQDLAKNSLFLDLRLKPDAPEVLNDLAWLLATSGDKSARDGAKAVQFAERACQQTQYQQTIMVGTLAAAYAEAGRFDDAVATAQKACVLAGQRGETNLLTRNQELLALYQKHQPYHEPGSAPANPAAH